MNPITLITNDPSALSSQPSSPILKSLSLQLSLTLASPLSLLIQERQHSLGQLATLLVYIQAVASWMLDGAQWVDFSLNMSSQASGKHCLGNQPNFPPKYISPLTALNFPHLSSSLLSAQAKALTFTSRSTRVIHQSWTPPVLPSGMYTVLGFLDLLLFVLFVCFAKVEEIQLSHQLLTPSLLSFAPFVSLRKCVIVLL